MIEFGGRRPIQACVLRACVFLACVMIGLVLQASVAIAGAKDQTKCRDEDFRGVTSFRAIVLRAIDGDSVEIQSEMGPIYSMRLLGIDTPETHYQGKSQGYWGEQAAERMTDLVPPQTLVRVELEVESCDKFGRVLGQLWRENLHINRQMVAEGWAVNYCIYPNVKYCYEFSDHVARNRAQHRRIFSDPTLDLPYDWRVKLRGGTYDKYVGSIRSQDVFRPNEIRKVPVEDRIFFMNRAQIRPPYRESH